MSLLRAHVVSAVAALMALAVGIALGAGPLQQEVTTRPAAADGDRGALEAARARVRAAERGAELADALASSAGDRLLRDSLRNRAVTVVELPGAAEPTVQELANAVTRAGGQVVSRVEVNRQLLSVANRQLVGELGSQLVGARRTRVPVPDEAGDYQRLGRLLARALVTGERRGDEVDRAGRSILAGLEAAGLVRPAAGEGRRGSLVLAVAGAPYGGRDQRDGAGTITATLLAELGRTADAVVLAGPSLAGASDGLVGQVRVDPLSRRAVSTVEGADRVAGAVAAVLALAADVRGRSRHHGSATAPDGVLPRLP